MNIMAGMHLQSDHSSIPTKPIAPLHFEEHRQNVLKEWFRERGYQRECVYVREGMRECIREVSDESYQGVTER